MAWAACATRPPAVARADLPAERAACMTTAHACRRPAHECSRIADSCRVGYAHGGHWRAGGGGMWPGTPQQGMCTPMMVPGAAAAPVGTPGAASPHNIAVVELVHAVERAQQAENLLATYKEMNDALQTQCSAYEQVRPYEPRDAPRGRACLNAGRSDQGCARMCTVRACGVCMCDSWGDAELDRCGYCLSRAGRRVMVNPSLHVRPTWCPDQLPALKLCMRCQVVAGSVCCRLRLAWHGVMFDVK